MWKKSAIAALALLVFGLIRLSEATPLSELKNLRQLDDVDESGPALVLVTRDAFEAVNESALGYLPVIPVLRVEDALAGAALSLSGWTTSGELVSTREDAVAENRSSTVR